MNCIQKQQLVSFPKVRIWKPWFRHFNNHKEFRNEGTVHLFSLMALFSYANFRSNERMISGERYMEAPGQWICKLGSLPRILRVHSKRQALEQLDYYEKYGFLTYEWLDEENEIIRFSITNWKEHCTSLQYNYYSYKGSGFFFFPLPVGRMLLRIAHKTEGIVFSELDAIMDMWLHTILNDPKVRGSEYMPVVYYSNMRGVPLLSYTYLAKRWGWSKSRVGRFMLKAGEYGIISRVSFSSSRGSVISMCRYREMIFGDTCEELELSSIGEIIGITNAQAAGAAFTGGGNGLVGVTRRAAGNAAAASATGNAKGLSNLVGGAMFESSLQNGGKFAMSVVGAVAKGSISSVGSITGDQAAEALTSYLGYSPVDSGSALADDGGLIPPSPITSEDVVTLDGGTAAGTASPAASANGTPIPSGAREHDGSVVESARISGAPPIFQNVEIGGGRITGLEVSPDRQSDREFAMYSTEQYMAPTGPYDTVQTVDGASWYRQYAQPKVEKTPYTDEGDKISSTLSVIAVFLYTMRFPISTQRRA